MSPAAREGGRAGLSQDSASQRHPHSRPSGRKPGPRRVSTSLRSSLRSSRARAGSTHSSASLGTPPGPPRGPAPGAWPGQLELERGRRSAKAVETRASRPLPADSGPLPSGRRAKPGGCDSGPCPFPGSVGQLRSAGRGPETRGAERAGSGAGPGRRALTQAATSRPAAASSSRVCPTPGKSSGLGRLLSTARASARSRASRRSIAQDCGDRAGVRRGGARATPHHTHNPARLGPHRRPGRVPLQADRAVLGAPAQRLFFLRDKSWGDAGPPGQGPWSTGTSRIPGRGSGLVGTVVFFLC